MASVGSVSDEFNEVLEIYCDQMPENKVIGVLFSFSHFALVFDS